MNPLHVRCAKALGWTALRLQEPLAGEGEGWRGIPPAAKDGLERFVPPFGEESEAGWACTGPLLALCHINKIEHLGEGFGEEPGWYVGRYGTYGVRNVVPGSTMCAAIAEWVAAYGSVAKSTYRPTRVE